MTKPRSKTQPRLDDPLHSTVFGLGLFPVVMVAALDDQGRSQVLFWLVIPLLVGALVLALMALRAYRRERARRQARQKLAVKRLAAGQQVVAATERRPGEFGAVVTMVALDVGQPESPRLPVPVLPPVGVKVCKTCGREYRTALTSCPFDQTKLVTRSVAEPAKPKDDYLDTRRTLMRCNQCERQYDLGAKFCPFDGEPLTAVEEEDASAYYDGEMVCPDCGATYEEDAYFCPVDGSRLHPVEPSANHQAFGVVPLVICPECRQEYPFSTTICPRDGRELLPLVGRKTGGFPRRGLGERQKICPECGDRYGNDVSYCAIDGAKLLQMN